MGDRTGDHTGDHTEDHTGDRTGDHTGDHTGDRTGDHTGDHTGDQVFEPLAGVSMRHCCAGCGEWGGRESGRPDVFIASHDSVAILGSNHFR